MRRAGEGPKDQTDSGVAISLPAGTVIQPMPRPPAVVQPSRASRAGLALHPVAAQHERMAAAHTEFLELQEQVHRNFLDHRRKLLERLGEALGRIPATDGGEQALSNGLLATFETEVTWDDEFLDAHVMPASLLLEPLGRISGLLPGFAAGEGQVGADVGILECDLEILGALAEAGETVLGEVRAGGPSANDADAQVHLAYRVERRNASDSPSPSPASDARPLARVETRYARMDTRAWEDSTQLEKRTGQDDAAPATPAAWPAWTHKKKFSERDIEALLRSGVFDCFGAGFERAASHTRTPPLPGVPLIRLASVDAFEKTGGPWSMGLLRARAAEDPDGARWVGDRGLRLARIHQGALQTLAFFAMAAGATVARDGWRFEPIAGQPSNLRFVDAPSLDAPLEYELVVERFEGAPFAAIVGDVRAWAGDKLIFVGRRLSLHLVPDWPLSSDRGLLADAAAGDANPRPVAVIDGFRIGYRSLLAGALGKPSDAFREEGSFFETGQRQMPRLPGPPYHFITRVTAVEGEGLTMRPGAEATFEYDVPSDAWYFDENGNRTMPFCVFVEVGLQTCGWLSVYVGCPVSTSVDVLFRLLDGVSMTMVGEVLPDSGILRTRSKVTSVSRASDVMLLSYKVECFVGERSVCHYTATFGYFPAEALALQPGLPTTDAQRAQRTAESPVVADFAARPERYFAGPLRLPGPMLLMIDRVTAYSPNAADGGKTYLRAEKDVDPTAWFFKAHFYSDPVQPGSLGLEMMLQLLQFFIIHEDLAKDLDQPYFEPLALDTPLSWKHRGQVRPENKNIVTDMVVRSVESRPDGVTVIADGSLWVGGVRCYEAKGMGMRVRSGRKVRPVPPRVAESVIDPAVEPWVLDHRPSFTIPVMPGMSMADRLAGAALAYVREAYPVAGGAPGWVIAGLDEVRHHGWLPCDAPKSLRTEVTLRKARAVHRLEEVQAWVDLYDVTSAGSPRRVSAGRVQLARGFESPPRAWTRLADAVPVPSPYEEGCMYWGPRLQLLRSLAIGAHGATAELDAAGADAPIGALHQILLDGALHAIPHDQLERWSPKIRPKQIGAPLRLAARFFGPPPRQGTIRCEIRFAGFDGANVLPVFLIQMIDPEGRVWATMRHVEVLLLFVHTRIDKDSFRPFLVERRYQDGAALSDLYDDRTELDPKELKRMDGLPGSVAFAYGLDTQVPPDVRVIAIKDHVARRARVHPSRIRVAPDCSEAQCEEQPSTTFPVSVEQREGKVIVRDAAPPRAGVQF